MARYTGPVCRLCRRHGEKLYIKGERCFTPKCSFDRRPNPPGPRPARRRKVSDRGLQLREKQRARASYGVLEKQFVRYYKEAIRRPGVSGENLVRLLETRLDNVVYRLGLADSRPQARQLVRHGHFEVNGRKTNIPSYQVSVGDVIKVRESAQSKTYFKDRAQLMQGAAKTPAWLKFTFTALSAEVVGNPAREDVEIPLNEQLIVEYYSR